MDWLSQFNQQIFRDLDPIATLLNLLLVVLAGHVLSWHYLKYAKVLTNRRKFARLFLFLAATTMMVISVVKTSLALSLGLVGALSIIRFRTPIKEPEDLAYVFLALATGIGYGADQRVGTTIMFLGILLAMSLRRAQGKKTDLPRLYAHVNTPLSNEQGETLSPDEGLRTLLDLAGNICDRVELRRVDSHEGTLNTTLALELDDSEKVGNLLGALRKTFPAATVSVVEASTFD